MKNTDKMKMEAKAMLLPNKSINSNLDLTYDKNIGRDFKILFAGDISFAENYVLEYSSRKNIPKIILAILV